MTTQCIYFLSETNIYQFANTNQCFIHILMWDVLNYLWLFVFLVFLDIVIFLTIVFIFFIIFIICMLTLVLVSFYQTGIRPECSM